MIQLQECIDNTAAPVLIAPGEIASVHCYNPRAHYNSHAFANSVVILRDGRRVHVSEQVHEILLAVSHTNDRAAIEVNR